MVKAKENEKLEFEATEITATGDRRLLATVNDEKLLSIVRTVVVVGVEQASSNN